MGVPLRGTPSKTRDTSHTGAEAVGSPIFPLKEMGLLLRSLLALVLPPHPTPHVPNRLPKLFAGLPINNGQVEAFQPTKHPDKSGQDLKCHLSWSCCDESLF